MKGQVILFGQAQRGRLGAVSSVGSIEEFYAKHGDLQEGSVGMQWASDLLAYQYRLIFVRVAEEGFAECDYRQGFARLLQQPPPCSEVMGIGLPGVGERQLLEATLPLCSYYQAPLLMLEDDLYDYQTHL